MGKTLHAAIVVATFAFVAPPLYAQQSEPEAGTYELPKGWVIKPTPGILGEPSILAKLAMSTDTGLGGEPRDGFYVETGNIISGEGWISAGPGYRRDGNTDSPPAIAVLPRARACFPGSVDGHRRAVAPAPPAAADGARDRLRGPGRRAWRAAGGPGRTVAQAEDGRRLSPGRSRIGSPAAGSIG